MRIHFIGLPLALFAHPALAAEITAASRIDAVTLYPDAAEVTRMVEVDLPAGASRLVFHALPAALDPASLRASGEGEAQMWLGAIETKKAPAAMDDGAFETQIKSLRAERDGAQVKIDALAAKQAMMLLYSRSGPEKLGDGKGLKPEDWGQAWDAVGVALSKVGDDLRGARAAAAEVDAKIKALEAARPAPANRGATQDVALDVEAPAAGTFRLALTYRIAGARWTPTYDARLDTGGKDGKPKMELARRALVAQTTGEDWTNVSLVLAAFQASGGVEAPQVEPQIVDFYEPSGAFREGVPAPMRKSAAPLAAAPSAAILAPPPERVQAVEQQSRIETTAYQATFSAPGRVSLAADGTSKTIGLSAQRPEMTLSWRISPARDPRAFLSAHFVNGEEAPLLPGPVSTYRDGALVGQSRMKLVAPGDAADLGFGADDRVSVLRAPVKRKENDPHFWQSKAETRDFRTVLHNLHDFPVHAVVTDQTPYSENAAITIETLPQTTPPDEKAPDGKQGVLVWRFDLAPGETKELRLAYRMKWPADRDVMVP